MRRLLPAVAAMAALLHAGAIKRSVFIDLEHKFDDRIESVTRDDPFWLMVNTSGVYLEGYGAVFTAQVNLVSTPTVSPFRQTIPKEDVVKVHARKLQRLPVLKQHMRESLVGMAATLDDVPANEQIALAVSLFYFGWEDTSGLPSQVLMQGERRKLIDLQAGRATPEAVLKVREF
ncbi:MAG: hypothetical protein IT158_20130 [Bryobacterales bacterium]|nr:hypothetical protein [Bryobacterales bacterium]